MNKTATKARPILFSAEMVRAILAGRKTQTRRVVKIDAFPDGLGYLSAEDTVRFAPETGHISELPCPYGRPGDLLYVKEAWASVPTRAYSHRGGVVNPADPDYMAVHRATWDRSAGWPWKSPIHMPRWASRLTLRITDVRVERVQDISETDARAEGCDGMCGIGHIPSYLAGPHSYHFAQLWDRINTKRGHPWESNPWVWVISFARVEVEGVDDA